MSTIDLHHGDVFISFLIWSQDGLETLLADRHNTIFQVKRERLLGEGFLLRTDVHSSFDDYQWSIWVPRITLRSALEHD